MARSLSNANNLLAAITDGLALAINRRSFSAASHGVVSNVVRGGGGVVKKVEDKKVFKKIEGENSWVPDPVTGYYRPANRTGEIDVAALRDSLLTRKFRQC
eukprot:TRINITY_DN466_c1_g1_i2.p1 TRINITY_DN466_c1_g1~~TRINITY_DN466_c1_g1_i2.p1  ORF type:complete len:117 (-),score=11.51 TRINITY_DN466_c1_g1_i2:81-383(-)